MATLKVKKIKSVNKIKSIHSAILNVSTRPNNCFLTLTHDDGKVIKIVSFGSLNIKGAKKGTLDAQESIFESMLKYINLVSIGELRIRLIDSLLPSSIVSKLESLAQKVVSIQSIMKVPHGGCRIKREKRK